MTKRQTLDEQNLIAKKIVAELEQKKIIVQLIYYKKYEWILEKFRNNPYKK